MCVEQLDGGKMDYSGLIRWLEGDRNHADDRVDGREGGNAPAPWAARPRLGGAWERAQGLPL